MCVVHVYLTTDAPHLRYPGYVESHGDARPSTQQVKVHTEGNKTLRLPQDIVACRATN